MSSTKLAKVFYYVPEDGEAFSGDSELNCFIVRGKDKSELRLSDIRENFPLPGQYHFRFQYLYQGKVPVWLDLSSETARLPEAEGAIVIKALRNSWYESASSAKKFSSQ